MSIYRDFLDQLMAGYSLNDLFDKSGMLVDMTKARQAWWPDASTYGSVDWCRFSPIKP